METSAEVMEACVCSSRDGVPRAFRTSARLSAGREAARRTYAKVFGRETVPADLVQTGISR